MHSLCQFQIQVSDRASKFVQEKVSLHVVIDNSHYRLILKLGKEMQINYYSKKEHTKISKIEKFGCEML